MNTVLSMAIKDLRILLRDKAGAFFIIVFPIVMGIFFGLIITVNSSGGSSAMRIAIVDEDQSEMSKKFTASLAANESVDLEPATFEEARESVRKGNRVGLIVIPSGFGETAGIFWEEPPEVRVGMDPSRSAEAGMMQGFIMESIGSLIAERFNEPTQFLSSIENSRQQVREDESIDFATRQMLLTFFGSVESLFNTMDDLQTAEGDDGTSVAATGPSFEFASVQPIDITRELDPDSNAAQLKKITSRWDISFPQAMLWGILGCVAGFAISIARERTLGTLVRLKVAPVSKLHILAGKAMACFITVMGVVVLMTLLGVLLGMKPGNYPLLVLAALCNAICFVGIMMTLSVLGKTEQSVSGSGWAINMVMAMFGGCMIPVMFMPGFLKSLSVLSPVRWAILSLEGAIWRDFSLQEMLLPCSILVSVGIVGLAIGTAILRRE